MYYSSFVEISFRASIFVDYDGHCDAGTSLSTKIWEAGYQLSWVPYLV